MMKFEECYDLLAFLDKAEGTQITAKDLAIRAFSMWIDMQYCIAKRGTTHSIGNLTSRLFNCTDSPQLLISDEASHWLKVLLASLDENQIHSVWRGGI